MLYFRHMIGGHPIFGRLIRSWRRTRLILTQVRQDGFTVIEVLIVLAVTAGLFVSAALMISGRQNQTAFDQGIRQIESQVQQIINEVSNGYFPDTDFNCTAGATGPVLTTSSSGGQGTKSGCIFVGKAIQFKIHGTDPEQFVIHTLAGLQKNSSGQETTGLIQALPKSIAPSTTEPANPDITTVQKLENGLTTSGMWYNNGAGDVPVGIVAFVITLPGYDAGGTIKAGAPYVQAIPVVGSALDTTVTVGADALGNNNFHQPTISPRDPSGGVSICFASGGTNQSALITIGGESRPLAVNLRIIRGNYTCS